MAAPPDAVGAGQPYAGAVAARRAAGTVSRLTVALANLALAEAALGLVPEAVGDASEGLRLARDTGQPATAAYFLVILAGLAANRGQTEGSPRVADTRT